MKNLCTAMLAVMIVLWQFSASISAQTRTIGLMSYDSSKAFKGYTLFSPKHNTMTYLINNEGRIMHAWTASIYPPGQSAYLLENGHLLRACMTKGQLSTGGGEGGRVEEYDWDGTMVWSLDFSTATYMQHHDIRRLPNGNIIMLVVEKKTYAEVIAAGFNPSKFQPEITQKGMMVPDCVYEIKPTYPTGGTVVWEWHVWDHLIQDYDSTKLNYGVVKNHPELISAAGDQRALPLFWNHMNSIDYNPALDQILLSVRGNSEVWVIDHSTTTAEAKSHAGGKHGKGGDLLYRWGNPVAYGQGTVSTEMLFQQHDAEWVRPDCPGAGDITVFNNGIGRNYSTIDQFTPPIDTAGNYAYTTGTAYLPKSLTWTYKANPPTALYGEDISGAQRLQNGNTLIDDGPHGNFLEVTGAGEVVWHYICPISNTGALTQGDTLPNDTVHAGEKMNAVFRIYRYPTTYAAFTGKTLVPGDYVEKYPTLIQNEDPALRRSCILYQNYPNPFNPSTTISYALPEAGAVLLEVYDIRGVRVATLVNGRQAAGSHQASFNAAGLASGMYFYKLSAGGQIQVKKMVVVK
jgi:hypothetical protein